VKSAAATRWRCLLAGSALVVAGCSSGVDVHAVAETESVSAAGNGFTLSLNKTDTFNGDTVVATGVGCVDENGSSEGLWGAAEVVPQPVPSRPFAVAPVAVDGSFTVDVVIPDSASPGNSNSVFGGCLRTESGPTIATSDLVPITVETPYEVDVSPAAVAPGAAVRLFAECVDENSAGYQSLSLSWDPESPFDGRVVSGTPYFVNGTLDATYGIRTDARPGEYVGVATCVLQRTPTLRFYRSMTITVTAGAPSTPEPSQPPSQVGASALPRTQ
jgi:hypothetical protein